MGTSVERASAEPELHRRAAAHRMLGERVDGDDLEAVIEAAARLMRRAREERAPAVLEALTYRHRGHSVADAGINYRSREEIEKHRARDPIDRFGKRAMEFGLTAEELDLARDRAIVRVKQAVEFAESSPEPPVEELAAGMYAPGSDVQFDRIGGQPPR